MKIRPIAPLFLALVMGMTACDDEVVGPAVDEVTGTYVLSELVVTQGTATNDLIEDGVTTTVTLNADMTTSGTLFIPASVNIDGVEINSDVMGTWSLDVDKVRFDHDPETYLTEVEWTYADGQLMVQAGWIDGVLVRQ